MNLCDLLMAPLCEFLQAGSNSSMDLTLLGLADYHFRQSCTFLAKILTCSFHPYGCSLFISWYRTLLILSFRVSPFSCLFECLIGVTSHMTSGVLQIYDILLWWSSYFSSRFLRERESQKVETWGLPSLSPPEFKLKGGAWAVIGVSSHWISPISFIHSSSPVSMLTFPPSPVMLVRCTF